MLYFIFRIGVLSTQTPLVTPPGLGIHDHYLGYRTQWLTSDKWCCPLIETQSWAWESIKKYLFLVKNDVKKGTRGDKLNQSTLFIKIFQAKLWEKTKVFILTTFIVYQDLQNAWDRAIMKVGLVSIFTMKLKMKVPVTWQRWQKDALKRVKTLRFRFLVLKILEAWNKTLFIQISHLAKLNHVEHDFMWLHSVLFILDTSPKEESEIKNCYKIAFKCFC